MVRVILITLIILFGGCNNKQSSTLSGNYFLMSKKTDKPIPLRSGNGFNIYTFGKSSFTLAGSGGGSYEINGDKLIMKNPFGGMTFVKENGIYRTIDRKKYLRPTTQEEIDKLLAKQKKEEDARKPNPNDNVQVTPW